MAKGVSTVKILKDPETVSLHSYKCFKGSDSRERWHLHAGTQKREPRKKKPAAEEAAGLYMVGRACKPSTQKAEAEFKPILGYTGVLILPVQEKRKWY